MKAHAATPISCSMRDEAKSSLLLRSVVHYLACTFILAIVLTVLRPPMAFASSWPVAGSGLSPALGFQQTYSAAGSTYTHCGIDITAAAGSSISAPLDAWVSFIGSVPSGDSSFNGGGAGETMLAVSLLIPDGRTVTLMPFASIDVVEGQSISEGQVLGTLASSGDRSSSTSHLHMGLKRGSVYYDPMLLFGIQASSTREARSTATAGALGVSSAAQPATAPELSLGTVQAEPEFGSITSGEVVWEPAVAAEPSVLQRMLAPLSELAAACKLQAVALGQGLHSLAYETGVPFMALVILLAVFAMAMLAGALFLLVRLVALTRCVTRRSQIDPLCSEEVTGKLRKLFPAPGTPS